MEDNEDKQNEEAEAEETAEGFFVLVALLIMVGCIFYSCGKSNSFSEPTSTSEPVESDEISGIFSQSDCNNIKNAVNNDATMYGMPTKVLEVVKAEIDDYGSCMLYVKNLRDIGFRYDMYITITDSEGVSANVDQMYQLINVGETRILELYRHQADGLKNVVKTKVNIMDH